MSQPVANAVRGEAVLHLDGRDYLLRPSFAALLAAEDELGPLFALVERAAAGELKIAEMAGLFWHCLSAPPTGLDRREFGEALAAAGIANATPALRILLGQILQGR